jgi:hypothetical protein
MFAGYPLKWALQDDRSSGLWWQQLTLCGDVRWPHAVGAQARLMSQALRPLSGTAA